MPKDPRPALITFGAGGHQVYYEPLAQFGAMTHQRSSGYRSPDNIFVARPRLGESGPGTADYEAKDFQGVPVIDMREAVKTQAGRHMAISGPMVQPGLKDQEVKTCPEPSSMLAGGLSGSFAGLASLQKAQKVTGMQPGALDMVSVPEYIRMWRMAGGKIGVVEGDGIKFEERAKLNDTPAPHEEQDEMLLDGALRPPAVDTPSRQGPLAAPGVEP